MNESCVEKNIINDTGSSGHGYRHHMGRYPCFGRNGGGRAVCCVAGQTGICQDSAAYIADQKANTRWESDKTDAEWCQIDLGESREVNIVSIDWEASCAAEYDIYLTDDITDWDSSATAEKAYKGAAATDGSGKKASVKIKIL